MPLRYFLVFAWREGEARGGWDDFVGSHDSLDGAVGLARTRGERWMVVDATSGGVVRRWDA